MMQELPHAVVMEANPAPARAAIIWLHGLGADGHDFVPVVDQLALMDKQVRTILPHAPEMPVSINGGHVMPAWYDIHAPALDQRQDEAGIRRSSTYLDTLIQRQLEQGLQPHQIVLAGFSQGGAIALHCGLRYPHALAGILALSTYLPLADNLAREHSAASLDTPVWLGHGLQDPVVPVAAANSTLNQLQQQGYTAQLHTYAMEHSVHPAEMADFGRWLTDVLKLKA